MNDFQALYAVQDKVLRYLAADEPLKSIDMVLSGGTGLARGWLHHRYSFDLYFMVYSEKFISDSVKVLHALRPEELGLISIREKHDTLITIEFVNENLKEPLRIQILEGFFKYGAENRGLLKGFPVDSVRNIFSNKIAAFMDRESPRDLPDIWAILAKTDGYAVSEIIAEAVPKGVDITTPAFCKKVFNYDFERLSSEVIWEAEAETDPSSIKGFLFVVARSLMENGEYKKESTGPDIDRKSTRLNSSH